jgi:hypothetical protein
MVGAHLAQLAGIVILDTVAFGTVTGPLHRRPRRSQSRKPLASLYKPAVSRTPSNVPRVFAACEQGFYGIRSSAA